MAQAPKPALSGAYAVIDCYGSIAIPIEMIQHLGDALRVEQKYENSKHFYALHSSQDINFRLLNAEQMTAMKVAHKLEG